MIIFINLNDTGSSVLNQNKATTFLAIIACIATIACICVLALSREVLCEKLQLMYSVLCKLPSP